MIAEWMGTSEEQIEFSGGTVKDLKSHLENENEKLKGISYQIAIDQKIAADNLELKEENEIALLPPFAGG